AEVPVGQQAVSFLDGKVLEGLSITGTLYGAEPEVVALPTRHPQAVEDAPQAACGPWLLHERAVHQAHAQTLVCRWQVHLAIAQKPKTKLMQPRFAQCQSLV